MTTSVTRPCFTTQHQTYKTKTDLLVSDWSCPKTDGLRPHHWCLIMFTIICCYCTCFSTAPNRQTFICPYCKAKNFDCQELIKHCNQAHCNDFRPMVSWTDFVRNDTSMFYHSCQWKSWSTNGK